jgi:hypothetical protein
MSDPDGGGADNMHSRSIHAGSQGISTGGHLASDLCLLSLAIGFDRIDYLLVAILWPKKFKIDSKLRIASLLELL